MKKSLLLLILTACFWQAFTQNRPVSPEKIQNSRNYIFDIGEGSNFDEADSLSIYGISNGLPF